MSSRMRTFKGESRFSLPTHSEKVISTFIKELHVLAENELS